MKAKTVFTVVVYTAIASVGIGMRLGWLLKAADVRNARENYNKKVS
jgi:hypothetical protein